MPLTGNTAELEYPLATGEPGEGLAAAKAVTFNLDHPLPTGEPWDWVDVTQSVHQVSVTGAGAPSAIGLSPSPSTRELDYAYPTGEPFEWLTGSWPTGDMDIALASGETVPMMDVFSTRPPLITGVTGGGTVTATGAKIPGGAGGLTAAGNPSSRGTKRAIASHPAGGVVTTTAKGLSPSPNLYPSPSLFPAAPSSSTSGTTVAGVLLESDGATLAFGRQVQTGSWDVTGGGDIRSRGIQGGAVTARGGASATGAATRFGVERVRAAGDFVVETSRLQRGRSDVESDGNPSSTGDKSALVAWVVSGAGDPESEQLVIGGGFSGVIG